MVAIHHTEGAMGYYVDEVWVMSMPEFITQLHLNGQADETSYTRAIRDWLTANGGRPNRRRRWAAEPFGTASLRSPRARRAQP